VFPRGIIRYNGIHLVLISFTVVTDAIQSAAFMRQSVVLSSAAFDVDTTMTESMMTSSTGEESLPSLFRSPVFGDMRHLRLSEDDEEDSFLAAMGVPTFAAALPAVTGNNYNDDSGTLVDLTHDARLADRKKPRGLEGVLNHGPAFVVDDVLTREACEQIISDCERLGFGSFSSGKNVHGAQQILVDRSTADSIAKQLAPHIDVREVEQLRKEMITQGGSLLGDESGDDIRMFIKGLNRRWRIYRYEASSEESFAPHIDAGFPPSGVSESGKSLVWDDSASLALDEDQEVVSRLTVLMYLNDDFVGGETKFFAPQNSNLPGHEHDEAHDTHIASVRPVAGSVLVFPQGVGEDAVEYARSHWPLHEGSPVRSGRPKYAIRSDVLFVTHIEPPPFEDDDDLLFRHDHAVRQTFMLKPSVWDPRFLSQANLLYNPCMGVENLGPFLYSFLRMTKKKRVVEIGAGYTTLWILQALKDNDLEMQSIRSIQRTGECKLLNIDWTIHPIVEEHADSSTDRGSSRLLCVDNCEHQRETASGAGSVAASLGLDPYLEFRKADAFDMKLPNASVDVLWCDFGVGSRMREFISSAWDCVRPGGFLLCHSTLTNENTRRWLEAVRERKPKEVTGIEPEEYVELSLLEPHKRFQNSVSILQRRTAATTGDPYEEPVYSQYA